MHATSDDPTEQISWAPAVITAENGNRRLDMVIDSNDDLHVAYGNSSNQLWYIKRADGVWKSTKDHQVNASAVNAWYFSIDVDSNDEPSIAVFNGSKLELEYSSTLEPTESGDWTAKVIATTGGMMSFIGFAIDAADGFQFSYRNNGDERFQHAYLEGVGEVPMVTDIVSSKVGWYTDLVLDTNSNVHIVFASAESGAGDFAYTTNANASGDFYKDGDVSILDTTNSAANCSAAILGGYFNSVYVDGSVDKDLIHLLENTAN